MADRFDVFSVKITPRKDANDFLLVDSTPTRAGVFVYRDSIGNEWGELRHEDDVFSKTTLDSLNLIPYTTQENHVELFSPDNAKGKTYGVTINDAERVDDHARVGIKIMDRGEIDAVEKENHLELSAGYRCDVINESGTYKGEKYEKRQKNIIYNHVARVENARGGETCRIRLDSKSAINGIEAERIDSEDISEKTNGESIMTMVKRKIPAIKLDGVRLDSDPVEIPAEYEGVVDRFEKRQETLEAAIVERDQKFDSLNEELTKSKAQIDVLSSENKDLKEANENSIPSEKLDSAVRERAKYLNYATVYKLDKAEDLSNDEILTGIVKASKKVSDESKLEDMTYTKAVFDMLDHEYEQKKIESKHNLDNHSVTFKDDGKVSSFDKARKNKGAA